jgi:hypothetical protein
MIFKEDERKNKPEVKSKIKPCPRCLFDGKVQLFASINKSFSRRLLNNERIITRKNPAGGFYLWLREQQD